MLNPMLAMIAWSGCVVAMLMTTRIPVVLKYWGNLQHAMHSDELRPKLPARMRYITDNYNHLLEQPTLFYATVVYIHIAGTATAMSVWLAWAYVATRVVHSVVQLSVNNVSWRAASFAMSSLLLLAMIIIEAIKWVAS
jgi:hypothetical protein